MGRGDDDLWVLTDDYLVKLGRASDRNGRRKRNISRARGPLT